MFGKEDINADDLSNFDDGSNFHFQQEGTLTHEQLILQQMKRVMEEGSKEMVGGYFKEQMTRTGLKEVYIPDQKQVYIRCIMSLYDIMIHEYSLNPQFKVLKEQFDDKIKSIKEKATNLLKAKLDYIEKQEKESGISAPMGLKENLRMQIITGMFDNSSYEARIVSDETLEAYRFLYQGLVTVYGGLGFGEEESIDDSKPNKRK